MQFSDIPFEDLLVADMQHRRGLGADTGQTRHWMRIGRVLFRNGYEVCIIAGQLAWDGWMPGLYELSVFSQYGEFEPGNLVHGDSDAIQAGMNAVEHRHSEAKASLLAAAARHTRAL